MYVVVWSFDVTDERRPEFERAYGPDGAWARLFSRSSDYRGTELLRDGERNGRYLTVDRWTSFSAYESFRAQWKAEYEALDRTCAALTHGETRLGAFDAT